MSSPERAVFDCNVLLQSLLSASGPAGKLVQLAKEQKLSLFVSAPGIEELHRVANRSNIQKKFRLTAEMIEHFCRDLVAHSTLIDIVPHVFDFPRDPDDSHYIDLAIAARAKFIVSRDHDLLSLRDMATPEGKQFVERFPWLEILTPPEALAQLAEPAGD
jgi:putative PIN family toxin of toxin-antitoxin system